MTVLNISATAAKNLDIAAQQLKVCFACMTPRTIFLRHVYSMIADRLSHGGATQLCHLGAASRPILCYPTPGLKGSRQKSGGDNDRGYSLTPYVASHSNPLDLQSYMMALGARGQALDADMYCIVGFCSVIGIILLLPDPHLCSIAVVGVSKVLHPRGRA